MKNKTCISNIYKSGGGTILILTPLFQIYIGCFRTIKHWCYCIMQNTNQNPRYFCWVCFAQSLYSLYNVVLYFFVVGFLSFFLWSMSVFRLFTASDYPFDNFKLFSNWFFFCGQNSRYFCCVRVALYVSSWCNVLWIIVCFLLLSFSLWLLYCLSLTSIYDFRLLHWTCLTFIFLVVKSLLFYLKLC